MIPVLIESRRPGRSAMVAVRRHEAVQVTGLAEGDLVILQLIGEENRDPIFVRKDSRVPIENGATYVVAEHKKCSKDGCVNISLE